MGVMRMRAICPNCGGKIHTQPKGLGHFTWMANGPLLVKTGKIYQFCGVALTGKVDMQNRQSRPVGVGRSWNFVACIVAVITVAACSGGGSDRAAAQHARDLARRVAERGAASKVVGSLRPGSAQGFDTQSWAAAKDPNAVLPLGATLATDRRSWDIRGSEASVNVTLSVPGRAAEHLLLLLHKAGGAWLVYGSMPEG